MSLAAVLVPLINRPAGLSVLLTQRTGHLRTHPSQISFPGGRVEAHDADLVSAALRETHEEVGIAPEGIAVIGNLPTYHTPSRFSIAPVVGWIDPPFTLELNAFEVSATFEVPLSLVLDARNYQQRSTNFEGRSRQYRALAYEGRYVWGATAAILYSLCIRLAADAG